MESPAANGVGRLSGAIVRILYKAAQPVFIEELEDALKESGQAGSPQMVEGDVAAMISEGIMELTADQRRLVLTERGRSLAGSVPASTMVARSSGN